MTLPVNNAIMFDARKYCDEIVEELKRDRKYTSDAEKIAFARTFCYELLKEVWHLTDREKKWSYRRVLFERVSFDRKMQSACRQIARLLVGWDVTVYAYCIGEIYTALLPEQYRAEKGIFYTPPALVERLLDLLTMEGADWAEATVLDPASGGGIFILSVVNRMLCCDNIQKLSPIKKLVFLEQHVSGIDLDKFAAHMAQVLLELMLYPEMVKAGRRIKRVIHVRDTIAYAPNTKRRYDIILGNPPFGRIKLEDSLRKKYERSLYGHANLYGLFLDAAMRLKKKNGLIGFVLPTSFLGGKYYSNLRNLLSEKAFPLAIDFLTMRSGIFGQVLQETCLAVFGESIYQEVNVSEVDLIEGAIRVESVGKFSINKGTAPWIIARKASEAEIAKQISKSNTTLADYGYKVSTGQLVWNRMKKQITGEKKDGVKPIIWAEAISADGQFEFAYKHREKLKYIELKETQDYLICDEPVILVQRTTAKEQERRLQACVLPYLFVQQWGGVVVENHVNIIRPTCKQPSVSMQTLSLILNSDIVDKIFRCFSGSVAVSAAELHALPLPPIHKIKAVEKKAKEWMENHESAICSKELECAVLEAYGLEGV